MRYTPKVFITRALEKDSAFRRKMNAIGAQVEDKSLVQFSPVSFSLPKRKIDWVFFYSQNAVKFFIQGGGFNELAEVSVAALGPGTKKKLNKAGIIVNFTGAGEVEEVAFSFRKLGMGKCVLFPRAFNSRQSVQRLLKDEIDAVDLVVYKNEILKDFALDEENKVLVFTSPLNVEAYFNRYQLLSTQKVVAIGNTTAKQLKKQGIEKLFIAKAPDEEALADAVNECLDTYTNKW